MVDAKGGPTNGETEAVLDRGLFAAFGPHDGGETVAGTLVELENRFAFHSRVMLRDDADETVHLVNPRSSEGVDPSTRYQVLGEIVRGGVGVVFKGRDTDLGRDVAMKVLKGTHASNASMVQRFVEESQIAGQLQHPGIPPVYELGLQPDRRPFFTMKLVKGRTLSALLDDRATPDEDRPRFLSIFEDVCQTIAYAHTRGVVHRDLKPSNIMVGAFGEVQVVDWGLAKVLAQGGAADDARAHRAVRHTPPDETEIQTVRTDRPGSQSIAGSVMGTPAYMAPEQARGDVDHVNERTDVFALGGILCEILTGAPPYRDEEDDMLAAAAAGRLDDALARLEASGAEAELVALARACLSPAPAARPRNAKVVADAVTAHVSSVTERAHAADLAAAEARTKAAEERRRRKLTIALAVSIVAALILGGAGFFWVEWDQNRRRQASTERVNDALAAANLLFGQAKVAPVDDQSAWMAVRAAGQNLQTLGGAGPLDDATRRRVDGFLDQLSRADRDRRLIETIENAVILGATHEDLESWLWMEERLRQTFLDYGIDPLTQSSDQIAERIRDSELTGQLADGLELWIATGFQLNVFGRGLYTKQQLLGWVPALFKADLDPLRTSIRDQLYAENPDHDELRRVAASLDFSEVPPRTLSWLASAFTRVNDSEGLFDVYGRAVLVYPKDLMLNFDYAYYLDYAERWDEASRYYVRCLGLRPAAGGIWRRLGIALRETGDLHGSLEALDQAILHQPDYAHTHVDRGYTLFRLGDVDSAIQSYRCALGMQADLALGHGYLGLAFQKQGRLEEALVELQECHQLSEGDPRWSYPSAAWVDECKRRMSGECARSSGPIEVRSGRPISWFRYR